MNTALICGVSGQDGAYLARLLLGKGHRVVGTTRDLRSFDDLRLKRLDAAGQVELVQLDLQDAQAVQRLVCDCSPDEIYNLSSQSSVGVSFKEPVATLNSIVPATLNLLEAIRGSGSNIRFCNAGSGEVFGNVQAGLAGEDTPLCPVSPYAAAKASAQMLVRVYRESYGLFASTAILFNHESPLRSERFVTRKIVAAAARIAAGSSERLTLGNLDVVRDWGWAPEHVEGMWRLLQHYEARDVVLATGHATRLLDFVAASFSAFGLQWHEHVDRDQALIRPGERNGARAVRRWPRRCWVGVQSTGCRRWCSCFARRKRRSSSCGPDQRRFSRSRKSSCASTCSPPRLWSS